ncbi:MAG: hypothetical protein ACYDD1_02490 [Caulobacteraceae bacterium]
MLRCILLLSTAFALSACAGMHPPHIPFSSGNGDQALKTASPAFERNPHRQYFDKMRKRYYYYDVARKSYFWEDGTPKG